MAATPSSSELWLIRTIENRIVGPFPKEELCQLILAGELGPQDEVCRADHYWFALHEVGECQAQLGIQPQFQKSTGAPGAEEEITETQTEVSEEGAPSTDAGPPAAAEAFEDIPDLPGDLLAEAPTPGTEGRSTQGTAVIRRAKKAARAAAKTPGAGGGTALPRGALPGAPATSASASAPMRISVQGISRMERPSIWRGAAWMLILTAGLIVYSVLKILRT